MTKLIFKALVVLWTAFVLALTVMFAVAALQVIRVLHK